MPYQKIQLPTPRPKRQTSAQYMPLDVSSLYGANDMGLLMYKNERSMSPGQEGSPTGNLPGSPTSPYKLEEEDLNLVSQRTIKGGMNYHASGARKDKRGNILIKRKDGIPDHKNKKKCPQKVLFMDQIGSEYDRDKQMIAQVLVVESFKKYN